MEKQKIYNILNVFLENYDENDLKKQNKQINLLIEEINHLEKENSNEIVALNNNENIIKKGMLLKIGDILYCLNDFKYEKEKSLKDKNKVLLMELINLNSPFTYYMSGRNNAIHLSDLKYEKNKNKIEVIDSNNNLDLIKEYVFEKAKFNQIIFSRIHFDSNINVFNLNNTNHFTKRTNKIMFPKIEGIELVKDDIISSYNKIIDIDLFKESYLNEFLKYNPLRKVNCFDGDSIYIDSYTKKNYIEDYDNILNNLSNDIEKILEIQNNLDRLENQIFNKDNLNMDIK